jgi:uncharacterized membrane protein YphA (DoxX/SURF4 family)
MDDLASLILRCIVGVFFLLARFRYVYDPSINPSWFASVRHMSLQNKMRKCGLNFMPRLWAEVTAYGELAGGLGLIVGLLTPLAAIGLLVILLPATACTAAEKINRQAPVDGIATVECYLWTPEPLYIALCVAILLLGPGAFSLDHYLWRF